MSAELEMGWASTWQAREGRPVPLGVSYLLDEQSYNFALYSKHATSVTLLLYALEDLTVPVVRYRLDFLRNKSGRVWHCRLEEDVVRRAHYYAYQVEGPDEPEHGHRFDPRKILLDPYAQAVVFPDGFSREASIESGSNEGSAPLALLRPEPEPFDWAGDVAPRHEHDTVIYELHVRGFTRGAGSGVESHERGTYAGLTRKIPYLKELGVSVVELMPVFQFDPLDGNYWGYMPLGFFAPHDRYTCGGAGAQVREFKEMVKAFHATGIEVVLDVVYNHTAEGNENGPTYSFRGIDNTTYYLLEEDRRRYRNDAGTGNVLHTANHAVRRLVLDSLRFWVEEMHVDGFRFDLASVFTRRYDGSIDLHDPPIIAEIQSDPVLSGVRLIAESWDPVTYQLGRAFPGMTWYQWNGQFRDDVRSFVRGDAGKIDAMMTRLYGSDDLFPGSLLEACHAYQSVNYLTSHDGFCLYDLVSYDHKHNEANGHDNADGTNGNVSWNCGFEGDDDAPAEVLALRRKQVKNFFALLMLANGTPMFCAGDEILQTQRGNNNPYNQDNETTWIDWSRLEDNRDVFRFFKEMIAFRKRHPSLARSRFWRDDVRWYGSDKEIDETSRELSFHVRGQTEQDDDIYAMINMGVGAKAFVVQPEGAWRRVIDTSLASPEDILCLGDPAPEVDRGYGVQGRSVVVLIRKKT